MPTNWEVETTEAQTDDKGRALPQAMSNREIAEETLLLLRRHDDLIMGIVGDLQSGKINPMQAMMGLFKR